MSIKNKQSYKNCPDFKDSLSGGLADEQSPKDFDPKQLLKGINVELEHTKDIMKAMEIAMDHLKEDPEYYIKLDKIESPKVENVFKLKEAGNDASLDTRSENRADVIKKYFNKLKKNHILSTPTPPLLGTGSYGSAFDIGGGKVLKITKDKTEAVASMKLIGKKNTHVVNVYEVFRFSDDSEEFGIVLEKLTPMSDGEKREFNRAEKVVRSYFGRDLYSVYGKTWEEWKEIVMDKLRREDYDDDEVAEVEEALDDLEAFKLDEMLEELKNNGISFGDFHTGNLMKRGKDYVITDLGQSKIIGGKKPPVLEKGVKQ